MQTAHRFSFPRGRVAIVASALLLVSLMAKEPQSQSMLAERELTKRRAAVEEAQELLTQGDLAYQAGRYADAVTAFSGAREMIPDAALTAELRRAATQRLVQASVVHAQSLSRKGDVAAAKAAVDAVLISSIAPNDPDALALRQLLDDPIRTNPALTKGHTAQIESVRTHLYTAQGAFNLGKYDEAKTHYSRVLRIDPTNSAARRGLEQVAAAKSTYQKSAIGHTRAEMLGRVDAGWETTVAPPILDVAAVDPDADVPVPPSAFVPVSNKLGRIVIPTLILENASLQDAVDLLRLRSAEFDQLELNPNRRGVNFHIDIGDENSETGNKIRATRFNLRLSGVPISQVLRYINEQTHTSYTTDDFTVIIRPRGADTKELVTRSYRVRPDFLSTLSSSSAVTSKEDPFSTKPAKTLLTERRGALEILREQGVQFPTGCSANFNPANCTLMVVNTAANQDIVSQIVENTSKTEPVMVCVRVTMIRAQDKRLKELGFDWLVSPTGIGPAGWIPGTQVLNFAGGTQGSGGNLGDIPLPTGQIDRNPVTAGNRSGDDSIRGDSIDTLITNSNRASAETSVSRRAPGILSVTKVLSRGSVEVLMRGLSQKTGVDVMTAASTVTRTGQVASVRMIREMIYPTEYEPPQLPQASTSNVIIIGGGGGGGSAPPPMVTPSHPTSFEKREVGIIFEVTPTVDEAKRFVEVALNPSLVNFDGFVNFGSPIRIPTQQTVFTGLLDTARENPVLSENRILMPVFSTQRLATNISVADGATIAVGGLIQSRIQSVQDITPILGNLPLVGRFFQSKANQTISTAVIFLVNVQIVDPTGQPFNKR